MNHMHNVEDCCAQLMEQLKALKEKWCATCVENVKLYKKIFELCKALNPGEDTVYHADVTDPAHCCGHHTVNVQQHQQCACHSVNQVQAVLPCSLYVGQGSAGKKRKEQTTPLVQWCCTWGTNV